MAEYEQIGITELPDFVFYCDGGHYFCSNNSVPGSCPVCSEMDQKYEDGYTDGNKAGILQEQERVEKLKTALNKIWIKPIMEELAQEIAGAALAELKAEDG